MASASTLRSGPSQDEVAIWRDLPEETAVYYLLTYLRSRMREGSVGLVEGTAIIQTSAPFAVLGDKAKSAILGFAAGAAEVLQRVERAVTGSC